MSKKAIAVFSLAYDPFVGGAEIAVKEIIRRNPDFDFSIFTKRFDRKWNSAEAHANLQILRLGAGKIAPGYYGGFLGKMVYILLAWRAAERAHKIRAFSGIWAIMASYAGIAALLFKLRHPSVPFLLTLQEGDPESYILKRVSIFYPLWKLIFKKADQVQAISKYLAEFAVRHGAIAQVEVVPNGVSLGDYHDGGRIAEGFFRIITTSRLVEKNAVDVLIKAAKYLDFPAEFIICGEGPQRGELEGLARGIEDENQKIKFDFRGHQEPAELPELLSQSDVFIRVSRSEGLGNSFLEAMAAGLPIIGTNVGGIPDFLVDGVTGLFAKVDDPKDLAEKITRLRNHPELRSELAEAGRQLVKLKYSWDNIAGKMNSIFKKLCVPLEI